MRQFTRSAAGRGSTAQPPDPGRALQASPCAAFGDTLPPARSPAATLGQAGARDSDEAPSPPLPTTTCTPGETMNIAAVNEAAGSPEGAFRPLPARPVAHPRAADQLRRDPAQDRPRHRARGLHRRLRRTDRHHDARRQGRLHHDVADHPLLPDQGGGAVVPGPLHHRHGRDRAGSGQSHSRATIAGWAGWYGHGRRWCSWSLCSRSPACSSACRRR